MEPEMDTRRGRYTLSQPRAPVRAPGFSACDDPIARGFEPTVELSDRDEPTPADSHDLEARQDLGEEERTRDTE